MTQSAIRRHVGQRTTARRISACAQQLADEHGLDGFTLEELAACADVSRRTLFNYFPSKVDAVLGEKPELRPDLLQTFRSGGPHHDLVEDLALLAHVMLTEMGVDRDEAVLHRRLLRANPRLLAAASERLEAVSEHLVAEILLREGPAFDADRARVAVRLLAALFEVSLDSFLSDSRDEALADLFTASLRTARQLFA